MPREHDIEPLSKQVTIIIGLTVVGLMSFGLIVSFYRNIIFDQTLRELEVKNQEIAKGIEGHYRELDYYRSTQFKDKYAKENFNKLNPGEKVIIITEPLKNPLLPAGSGSVVEEEKNAKFQEIIRQMPVPDQWWMYLFHPEAIENIRNSL